MFNFKILNHDKKTKARKGVLVTPHGKINTPNMAIVATKGSIRGLSFDKAKKFGADIFMINTFHFFHNNRYKTVKKFGGLHKFLNLTSPLMTDSGGFQVFSLGFGLEQGVGKIIKVLNEKTKNNFKVISKNKNLVKIYNDGVEFISRYNGEKLFFSPELSIKIQQDLGSDIVFAFDECTSPLADYNYTKLALQRTHSWALKCLKTFNKNKKQVLFGIVQGGEYRTLRQESARFINSLPFFGFGIGGAFGNSFGQNKKDMIEILKWTLPLLDQNKPRHLLGIGEIDDIFNAVELGIDLFDCVIPTRWARHGAAFSYQGRINLKSSKFLTDKKPIDSSCKCKICQKYSRAYICHLLREKEIYGIMILAEHNVFWILNLFKEIRKAIQKNNFLTFKKSILRHI